MKNQCKFTNIYEIFELTDKLTKKVVISKEIDFEIISSTMLYDDYNKLNYPSKLNASVGARCGCENDCCGCICNVTLNAHKQGDYVFIVYRIDYNY